jgi:MSHA biogenesis protein MshJ
LNEQLLKASAYIDARTPRERTILIAVTVALIYFVADALLLATLFERNAQLETKLKNTLTANETIQREAEHASVIVAARQQAHSAQKLELRARLQRLDQQLDAATSGFVPANTMPELLEQMLNAHKGLTLQGLENLPVQTIYSPESSADKNSEAALYRHGVRLQLQGGYTSALDYLQQLESLQWHFEWDNLRYIIDEYPKGQLSLEIFTYSADKEWIGV